MFSPLRNRFGIPGVISVIALVFAMLGGAYAATNSSGGGKATASAKTKKGPRGPKGATGPAGPAGPAGAAGANGKDGLNGLDGEDGKDGKNGTNGTNGGNGADGADGTNGTSVANTSEPAGANCTEGGTKLVGTSTTYACNGLKGADGEDGETGFTETLPAGKTETGAWSFGFVNTAVSDPNPFTPLRIPISFPIPLAAELSPNNVHLMKEGESSTESCPGSSVEPKAKSGHLCLYTGDETEQWNEVGEPTGWLPLSITRAGTTGAGASTAGAILNVLVLGPNASAYGTWAVTS